MNATVTPAPAAPTTQDGDKSGMGDVFRILWSGRGLIIGVTLLCTAGAAAASFILPKKYDAVVLLSPVTNQAGSGGMGALGSAMADLGGLASLAGLPPSGASSAKAEALATLQSEALTERYIRENDLLPVLYASKWDAERGKWRSSGNVPTLWTANRYFYRSVRTMKETARTGLTTMTITWTDPKLAATWANGLVKMTNDYLRQKAIAESERNIAFLNEQLPKTDILAVRDSMYSLMETEIKKQMLARGSDEYALKVIDPAFPPEKAAWPSPGLWTTAGFSAGLLLSSAYVFVRSIAATGPRR